jgi:hypothetical protein
MKTPKERDPDTLFDEWSDLNNVNCDWRSRFDDLREKFSACTNREQAEQALIEEQYNTRYPRLPKWLKPSSPMTPPPQPGTEVVSFKDRA